MREGRNTEAARRIIDSKVGGEKIRGRRYHLARQ